MNTEPNRYPAWAGSVAHQLAERFYASAPAYPDHLNCPAWHKAQATVSRRRALAHIRSKSPHSAQLAAHWIATAHYHRVLAEDARREGR